MLPFVGKIKLWLASVVVTLGTIFFVLKSVFKAGSKQATENIEKKALEHGTSVYERAARVRIDVKSSDVSDVEFLRSRKYIRD